MDKLNVIHKLNDNVINATNLNGSAFHLITNGITDGISLWLEGSEIQL